MAKGPISARSVRAGHKVVRRILGKTVGLSQFFAGVEQLTPRQRAVIVDQAILLLESFYVHLPLKRAMYAVDPLQRLRLLRRRLRHVESDWRFHAEMVDIFTSLRDLHTNYILPAPFTNAFAWLPFRVEACVEGGRRKYLVTRVLDGLPRGTFGEGVEILHWSGIPIARAVEMAGAQSAGSNPAARHANGLQRLTARPLLVLPPPDEEWVVVGYRTPRGRRNEVRVEWTVTDIPEETDAVEPRGLSYETTLIQRLRQLLFAPDTVQVERRIAGSSKRPYAVKGTETKLRDFLRAEAIPTRNGKVGYIRIYSFDIDDPDALVLEFIRLMRCLPQDGLIIDVRDNGGGRTSAAERLLQLISPRQPIEPERVYFINSRRTLQLCRLQRSNLKFGPSGAAPWIESIQRSMENGAMYSASFPYTDPEACNAIGRLYPGRAIVITNALSYSATEFFAAGFQDHGGKVVGVDATTGGGGANVKTHEDLRAFFKNAPNSPFEALPRGAGLRVAYRRSLRVGPQIGNDVEDFGVTPDYFHAMTRNDILNGNVDLINYAASLVS
jgi:hypothetical protein